MDVQRIEQYSCPIEAFLGVLGGKYKAIICYELIGRTLRYSELARLVPAATPRMLSRQLKELEADGIVDRKLYPVVPPKTEYSLTELGQTLVPLINAMCDWGYAYFDRMGVSAPEENANPLAEAARERHQ